MKNRKIQIILCVATIIFLLLGASVFAHDIKQRKDYEKNIEQVLHSAENPDKSALESAVEEESALQAQLDENSRKIAELEKTIAEQEKETAQLEQEYIKQAEEVDAEYYESIIKSLSEGVSLVEEHLGSSK